MRYIKQDKLLRAAELCSHLRQTLDKGFLSGRVLSVFDHAVNLQTPAGLVSLLTADRALYPDSIRLLEHGPFSACGLRPGIRVELDAKCCFFPKIDLTIDLQDALVKDLSIFHVPGLIVPDGLYKRLSHIVEAAARRGTAEGLAPLLFSVGRRPDRDRFPPNCYTSFLWPRFETLFTAIRSGDLEAAAAAAAQMAGCGPGLTPSSDDFLTGFMAALLTRSAADNRIQPVLALTKRMADSACPKTNAISGGFLAQSAQGLFSEDVISPMTALFSEGDPQALSDAAYKVACFGETSGTDILTGIYFGAKI